VKDGRTDRPTDRQTDRIAIANTRLAVPAVARKNGVKGCKTTFELVHWTVVDDVRHRLSVTADHHHHHQFILETQTVREYRKTV